MFYFNFKTTDPDVCFCCEVNSFMRAIYLVNVLILLHWFETFSGFVDLHTLLVKLNFQLLSSLEIKVFFFFKCA